MKSKLSPNLRAVGCLIVACAGVGWLAPTLDQLVHTRLWQAKFSANEQFVHRPGTNHHVNVTDFRPDSLEVVGAVPFGPDGGPYIVYLPLLPARAVGRPLAEDVRLLLRVQVTDPQKEVPRLLEKESLSGIVRLPGMTYAGRVLNEDELMKNWLADSPGRWYVLDAVPRTYTAWSSFSFLVPLLASLWCAYRATCLLLLGQPMNRIVRQAATTSILFVAGFGLLLLQPAGPAPWNFALPYLSAMALVLAIGGLPAVVSQWLLVRLREQEKKANAGAGKQPDAQVDPHAPPFEPTQAGFIVREGAAQHEFLDAAVAGLALETTPCVDEQGRNRVLRTARMRVVNGKETETFTISNAIDPATEDKLHTFFTRLLGSMTRRYGSEIKATGVLNGQGWSLSACGLLVEQGDQKLTFGPKLLNSGEWVQDRYCVWTASQEEPVLSLPAGAENVRVLAEVLPLVLPAKLLPTNYATGLGRQRTKLQATQRQRLPLWFMAVNVGIAAACWGLGLAPEYVLVLGAGLVAMQFLPIQTQTHEFRCFDHGATFTLNGETKKIAYAELKSSTWNMDASRQRSSRKISLTLVPEESDSVTFELPVQGGQAVPVAIRELRLRVTEATSPKILEELARAGSASWTPEVQLQFEGFTVSGQPLVKYQEIVSAQIDWDQERLVIKTVNGGWSIPTTAPNFDAGWQVFQLIQQAFQTPPPQTVPTVPVQEVAITV